jgi:hypothetical protein
MFRNEPAWERLEESVGSLSKTLATSRHVFPAGSAPNPGRDDQILTSRYNSDDRTYDVEFWRFASDAPVWTHEACPSTPFFSSREAIVVCPEIDIDKPVILLDASNGRVLDASAPRPDPDPLPEACNLDESGSPVTLSTRDQPLLSLFDLTPTEWAIALPTGQFIGTPEAPSYLAFYAPSGDPLSRDQVEHLRDPRAVQNVLTALPRIAACSP